MSTSKSTSFFPLKGICTALNNLYTNSYHTVSTPATVSLFNASEIASYIALSSTALSSRYSSVFQLSPYLHTDFFFLLLLHLTWAPNLSRTTRDFKHKSTFWTEGSTRRLTWVSCFNYCLTLQCRSNEIKTKAFIITFLWRQCHSSHHCPDIFLFWSRKNHRINRRTRRSWRTFCSEQPKHKEVYPT